MPLLVVQMPGNASSLFDTAVAAAPIRMFELCHSTPTLRRCQVYITTEHVVLANGIANTEIGDRPTDLACLLYHSL